MAKVKLGDVLIEQKKRIGVSNGNNLPLIGVSNKEGLILSKQARISDLSKYKLIKKGWFAYNPMRINVGSIGYSDSESKTGIISPDYIVFSCGERILSEYFLYFIKSPYGLEEISNNTGGSVRERLYFKNLAQIEIELPEIKIQHMAIKSFEGNIERLKFISHNLIIKTTQDLKELKQEILQLAIQGKLTVNWRSANPNVVDSSELLKRIEAEKQQLIASKKIKKSKKLDNIKESEKYFNIPQSWTWKRLGDIGNIFNGNSVNKRIKEIKYAGLEIGYPYIATKDVGYSFQSIEHDTGVRIPYDESKFKVAKKDTVLICSEGGSAGKKMGVVHEDCCFGNKLYAFEQYGDIDSSYILSLYGSLSFSNTFQEKMTGIIGGISRNNFADLLIPIPPHEEQKAIAQKVNTLMGLCDEMEKQINNSQTQIEQLTQSCLREVFEG